MSFPVSRGGGRALVVGSASNRAESIAVLQQQLGVACSEVEDPYAAMAELARRPMVYRTLVLSLASLFKPELGLVATVKRRLPHVDIWLTHTDGRAGMLAEAMRLGADGLLTEDGLHRTAVGAPAPDISVEPREQGNLPEKMSDKLGATAEDSANDEQVEEPVLTADELKALLQDQTDVPAEE